MIELRKGFLSSFCLIIFTLFLVFCSFNLEVQALSIKKNDEVLMPSYNYNTTASSFVRTGCKIRYCDIEKHSLLPSYEHYMQNISKNTKAIIVIHMQGMIIKYIKKLKNFCKKNKIILIEDGAPSLGTFIDGKSVGSFGDFSTFSFHETKNINSGEGGMLVCNDLNDYNIPYNSNIISFYIHNYTWDTPKYHTGFSWVCWCSLIYQYTK